MYSKFNNLMLLAQPPSPILTNNKSTTTTIAVCIYIALCTSFPHTKQTCNKNNKQELIYHSLNGFPPPRSRRLHGLPSTL